MKKRLLRLWIFTAILPITLVTVPRVNVLADEGGSPLLPQLSSVLVSSTISTSTVVSWISDIPATSYVDFGFGKVLQQVAGTSSPATSHSVFLQDLNPATDYNFQVRSKDGNGNEVASRVFSFRTSPGASGINPYIDIPPAGVSNLTATATSSTAVVLSWTAPGNDGLKGVALQYDIRYSSSPIEEYNWTKATAVTGEPDPQVPGSTQIYTVAGLTPGAMYYFALKTTDTTGLVSVLSNTVGVSLPSSTPVSVMPSAPRQVTVSGLDGQAWLAWANSDNTVVRYMVVRRQGNTAPQTISDGTVVYEGTAKAFTDTGLTNDNVYSYSVFSYNDALKYSNPLSVTVTPQIGKLQFSTALPVLSAEPVPIPTPNNPVTPPTTNPGAFKTGMLVNDRGTIYLIVGNTRIGFASFSAFSGLGYRLAHVVAGDTSSYQTRAPITTAAMAHPVSSWVLHQGTVYYVHEQGLIGVPSWDIFVANGGTVDVLLPANPQDLVLLSTSQALPVLATQDSRVQR